MMAWHRPGDKPLSEPVMVRLPTHICGNQPQWVTSHPHPYDKATIIFNIWLPNYYVLHRYTFVIAHGWLTKWSVWDNKSIQHTYVIRIIYIYIHIHIHVYIYSFVWATTVKSNGRVNKYEITVVDSYRWESDPYEICIWICVFVYVYVYVYHILPWSLTRVTC